MHDLASEFQKFSGGDTPGTLTPSRTQHPARLLALVSLNFSAVVAPLEVSESTADDFMYFRFRKQLAAIPKFYFWCEF